MLFPTYCKSKHCRLKQWNCTICLSPSLSYLFNQRSLYPDKHECKVGWGTWLEPTVQCYAMHPKYWYMYCNRSEFWNAHQCTFVQLHTDPDASLPRWATKLIPTGHRCCAILKVPGSVISYCMCCIMQCVAQCGQGKIGQCLVARQGSALHRGATGIG